MNSFFNFFQRYRKKSEIAMAYAYADMSHKIFPFTKKIPLKNDTSLPSQLVDNLSERESLDIPLKKKQATTFKELSNILYFATSTNKHKKRVYPSGGGKYPVGIYILVNNVATLHPGIYYYNQNENYLNEIKKYTEEEIKKIKRSILTDYYHNNFIVLFSFLKDKAHPKYGSLSYELALLEAGHIAQNILLVATAQHIALRPTLSIDAHYFNTLCMVDETNEYIFYALVG